ncbi:MAG: DUF308 domain-containing protein [Candidatus Saccharibacteria bacterium]|nr:DUF308 domain-containing protein [Candidatus Saccharibacteria bacterium]
MQKEVHSVAWALGIWGALSVVFGGIIFAWPGITLKIFLVILGLYFVLSGLVMLVGSLIHHQGKWITGAVLGGLTAVAGLYVLANPQISGLVALYVIALWAITAGLLQVVAGFEEGNSWWLVVSGVIYALFGFYIFANPAGGALALIWFIGLSVIIGGISLIITAFEINKDSKKLSAKKA